MRKPLNIVVAVGLIFCMCTETTYAASPQNSVEEMQTITCGEEGEEGTGASKESDLNQGGENQEIAGEGTEANVEENTQSATEEKTSKNSSEVGKDISKDTSQKEEDQADNKRSGYSIALGKPELEYIKNVSTGVEVSWTAVKGADTYYIYRKMAGASWQKIGDTVETKYIDSERLSSGSEYIYTVRAVQNGKLGEYDHTGVRLLYIETPVLDSAKNVSTGIKVTWEKVKGATKYCLYRKKQGAAWEVIARPSNPSYIDRSKLVNGEKYIYTVRAYIKSERSDYSPDGAEVIKLSTPSLSGGEIRSDGFKLTWKAVDGAEGYRVYRKSEGGAWTRIDLTTATSYLDQEELASGKQYFYTVMAYKGKYTSYYDIDGIAMTKLSNPELIEAKNASGGIRVTWKEVKGADQYWIYRKKPGNSWTRIGKSNVNRFVDGSDLLSGDEYIYTVRARKSSDMSYYDTAGVRVRKLDIPPLVSVKSTGKGLQLTWKEVKGAEGYRVYRKTSGSSWTRLAVTEETNYVDAASLTSGRKYTYTIMAYADADTSYYDTRGISVTKLSNPELVEAKNANGGIRVTWKSVKGAEGYWIYRKLPGESWTRIGKTEGDVYTDIMIQRGLERKN